MFHHVPNDHRKKSTVHVIHLVSILNNFELFLLPSTESCNIILSSDKYFKILQNIFLF